MSAEGQTIREALDYSSARVGRELGSSEHQAEIRKGRDALYALLAKHRALEARLAAAERALREIDTLSAITPDVVRPIVRAALPSESGMRHEYGDDLPNSKWRALK